MPTLQEIIVEKNMRKDIIDDCVVVLNDEVRKKSGMSGLLIKGGFKVIQKMEGGRMVHRLVDFLLDEFVEELEPYHQEYLKLDEATRPTFDAYLSSRSDEVADSLLNVTDRRRQKAKTKILIKTYDKLRGVALKNVRDGVPGVGRVIQKRVFS